jgi:hypothetical protein
VQAINPFSLLWTAKRAFLILDGKLRADREDFAMGFRPQSMVDYCIEIFLRNAPSRAKAEINLYVFIKSMKEHYQSCAILKLLARLLGITNGSTASNKDKDKDNATGGGRKTITSKSAAATAAASSSSTTATTGAASASTANATSNGTSAAAGNVANAAAKETKDAATDSTGNGNGNATAAPAANSATSGPSGAPPKRKTHHPKAAKNHFKDHNFFADETVLSKEVLAICLFARDCLLSAPYHGVYHTTLHGIRTKCAHYLQDFETSLEKTAQKIFAHTQQQQTPTNAAPAHSTATAATAAGGAEGGGRTSRHSATSPTKKKTTPDYIPRHVYTNYGVQEGCAMYVPLDRAVHVLLPFTQHLSHAEVTSILHYLEDEAVILQPGDGKIYVPDGQRSFIRHVVRLFAYSENRTGRDIESWQYLCDHYSYTIGEENHNFAALKEDVANAAAPASDTANSGASEGPVSGGGAHHNATTTHRGKTAAHHLRPSATHPSTAKPAPSSTSTTTTATAAAATMAPTVALTPADSFHLPPEALLHCLVVNLDVVLLVVAEICRRKLTKVEQQLKVIFEEGDVNHDNVLSFDEFREIVLRVDAACPDRKILRMFREALIQGGDKDVIGPLQYLNVCKDFNLIHLVRRPAPAPLACLSR